ncbi:MAG: hypothetical protein ACE1Z4_03065 [Gammaproteobacteria bacterium]
MQTTRGQIALRRRKPTPCTAWALAPMVRMRNTEYVGRGDGFGACISRSGTTAEEAKDTVKILMKNAFENETSTAP